MSNINTSSINAAYPSPGINNSSQGFRDNFAAIKNNLDAAGTELTDLQNKAIVKSSLDGITINNDMANTLISNALVKGFRSLTTNLGSGLEGNVKIDVSSADVQSGTVVGDTTLSFVKWPPNGTSGSVELQFTLSTPTARIIFPSNVKSETLAQVENANVTSRSVTAANGVSQLNFVLSTVDCGDTLSIQQVNRPQRSTQLTVRTPSAVGFPGDTKGTVCIDSGALYICTANYDGSSDSKTASNTYASDNKIKLADLNTVDANDPIVFTGVVFGGVTANVVYYVKSIDMANTKITISASRTAGVADSAFVLTDGSGTMTATVYSGTSIWKKIALTSF